MFIAGRIEFLGKHTDYCGGRSLVCAIDKGFKIETEANDEDLIVVNNSNTGESVSFKLNDVSPIKEGHWSAYPQITVQRIVKNFKSRKLRGAKIDFSSDLLQAAGVSSSSAFIVAIFSAISRVNNLPDFEEYRANILNKFDLGNYLGCIENGYSFKDLKGNRGVGTFGGSQDQTAIVCCKENRLTQVSFCPVRFENEYTLPENMVFVVASSGVVAEKTKAAKDKYNRLSLMSNEIVRRFDGNVSLANIVEKYGFERVKSELKDKDLIDRLTQFYVESYEIIPKVSRFLQSGEIDRIGVLIDKSHRNADELLGNQVAETNFLQSEARNLGAMAASAFGAGFGGSVYALVEKTLAADFAANWKEKYLSKFPNRTQRSEFFITKASESKF